MANRLRLGLRIKWSSLRIRPWPLRWVLGQGSLLTLSQGEAFTLASISYLAILVKIYTGKKKKKKRSGEPFGHVEKCRWVFWKIRLKNKYLNEIVTIRSLEERRHDTGPKKSLENRRLVKGSFFNKFKDSLSGDLNISRIFKHVDLEKFPMKRAKSIFGYFEMHLSRHSACSQLWNRFSIGTNFQFMSN